MKQIVIMPGGFHPFHAGHYALYKSAIEAFPNADVYVAATNDQSERPFPFAIKEKLAKLAGVAPGRFIQVKSPFKAEEITSKYNPNEDVLIFVRSEKDKNEQPKPGGTKKDGTPAYFQPWTGKNVEPFSKHAYMAYLPTVVFGPGITSATQIRKAWPTLNDKRKLAMVFSLYPDTQKKPELAKKVVSIFDQVMGTQNIQEDVENKVGNAVVNFYKPVLKNIDTEKVDDYVEQARNLMGKTNDPSIREKLLDIFKKGKQNPYLQGGIITTVGALLAGGILNSSHSMGLTPQQTNLVLQGVLNTVIPTLVSRVNGKNWIDTIKYTLASAGVGTGIAALTEKEIDEGLGPNYPGTYEEENKPFMHKGSYRITDITSEDVNEEHVYSGNAPGEAVRKFTPKHVPNQHELNRKKGMLPESVDYLEEN